MSKKTRFVLTSGKTKNSYGFKVKTSGISLKRFKANPVMLSEHNYSFVLGKWEDIEFDKDKEQLSASPIFDTEDPETAKVEGKVERGFVNGASVGISFNPDDFEIIDNESVLTKCELVEASICAIPSDSTALKLYHHDSETPLTDKEVGELCLSFDKETNFKNNNMNKPTFKLSAKAVKVLGLNDSKTEFELSEVETAVLSIETEIKQLKIANEAYKVKEEQAQAELCKALVDDAFKAGKITADKKEIFLKMAKTDYQLAKDALGSIPAKNSYGKNLGGKIQDAELSLDDFCKMELSAQLEWQEANPEAYAKMVVK